MPPMPARQYYISPETYGANEAIIKCKYGYEYVLDQVIIKDMPAYHVAVKSDNGIDSIVVRGRDIIAMLPTKR